MDYLTVPPANPVYSSYSEITPCPNRHPSNVCSSLLAGGHDCPHYIAGLETMHNTTLLGSGAWKTVFVYSTHLAELSASGLNLQGYVS